MGVQCRDLIYVIVGPGQDSGPARRANRIGAEAVVQTDTALCDSIKIRRGVDPAPVATHGVRSVVVGHNVDYIGPGGFHRERDLVCLGMTKYGGSGEALSIEQD